MVDFLKNAFGAAFAANASGGVSASQEFVGQTIDVGHEKYRIRRLIAEGGFAYVYEAQEVSTGNIYAVKRLLATDDTKKSEIVNEISVMKKLSGHSNIVRLVTAASIDKQASTRGTVEFIVVMELCTQGQLVDVIARRPGGRKLGVEHVCQILYQTASAVQHCHTQRPPIVHRDLKLENLLLDARGMVKLCDFGSSTTRQYEPDASWSAMKRGMVEDEVTRNTTPMYRAPEMVDLYLNMPIGTPADIWMLGCILFALCFERHPFEDSAKLKILNANYVIPLNDRDFTAFHELIKMMLQVDPRIRPTVDVVMAAVEQIAHEHATRTGRSVPLDGPISLLPTSMMPQPNSTSYTPHTSTQLANALPAGAPPRPPPLAANANARPTQTPSQANRDSTDDRYASQAPVAGQGAAQMFSALKSGAGALFTRVKDASSRVMDVVQANVNVTAQGGQPDLSYLTSRIVVMSFPSDSLVEQALRANNANDVRSLLDRNHPEAYVVYNLAGRNYPKQRFGGRVIECTFSAKRAPPLSALVGLTKNVHAWLTRSCKNCAVIHCMDGKTASCMLVSALLCLERMFDNVDACLVFFARRRTAVQLSASQRRYLNYLCKLVHPERPIKPQRRVFKLLALTIKPVPLFNRTRTGCRPYLDVFCGQDSVYSTLRGGSVDSAKVYSADYGRVQFELNAFVYGDVTICCNHARVQNASMANRLTSAKLFDLQFHTGFLDANQQFVHFELDELDCTESGDKYPEGFVVVLEIEPVRSDEDRRKPKVADADFFAHTDVEDQPPPSLMQQLNAEMPWDSLPADFDPRILCESDDEFQNVLSTFASLNRSPSRLAPLATAAGSNETFYSQLSASRDRPSATPATTASADAVSATRRPPDSASFFETLQWQSEAPGTGTPTRDQVDDANFADFAQFADFTQFNAGPQEEERTPSTDVDVDELIDVGLANPEREKSTAAPPSPSPPTFKPATTTAGTNLDDLFASVSVNDTAPVNSVNAGGTDNLLNFEEDRTSAFDLLRDAFTTQQQPAAPPKVSTGLNSSSSFSSMDAHGGVPTVDLFGDFSAARPSESSNPFAQPQSIDATRSTKSSQSLLDDLFGQSSVKGAYQIPNAPIQAQNASAKPHNPLLNTPLNASSMHSASSQPELSRMNAVRPPNVATTVPPPKPPGPQQAAGVGAGAGANANPFWSSSGSYQPSSKPNYDANLFSDVRKPTAGSAGGSSMGYTGLKPPTGANDFADLLGGQKLGSGSSRGFAPGKAKLNDMLVAKEVAHMTPDEARVYAWAYGKETNLRGMLASLHTVITWQTDRWTSVALHELVQPDQVRRYYKRACLVVHPDKLGEDNPYQNLGRLILMELNKAHETFEKNELEADMQTPAQ